MEKRAKLFLVLSLIGIVFLIFISFYLAPKQMKISEINERNLNQYVQVEGKIISIKDFTSKDFILLTLEDETGKITITAFSEKSLNLTGKEVIISGKVTEYNKELQINAEEINLK